MEVSSPPLSLYVHFPWCVRKCPYCDFNSHTLRRELPEQAYVDTLIRDLDEELAPVEADLSVAADLSARADRAVGSIIPLRRYSYFQILEFRRE